MRYASLFLAAIILPACFGGAAHAEITIHRANYAAGVLVVRGEASEPNQLLTLDDRYETTSDRNKDFMFRVRYLPRDCMVDIVAGREAHPVMVSNCYPEMRPDDSGLRSEREKDSSVVSAKSQTNDPGQGSALRVVRQPCEPGQECRVTCREDELAINAFCPTSSAKLMSERTVSCGADRAARIVAYCVSTDDPDAEE